jgi:alanine racemase
VAGELNGILHGRRQTWIEVDLDALAGNLAEVRRRMGGGRRVMAIVKADAYGHGAVPVARRLERERIDLFGVTSAEEGCELREAGIRPPIVVLGPADRSQVGTLISAGLTPVVYGLRFLDALLEESARRSRPIPFHLKVDTGMGRLGVTMQELPDAIDRIRSAGASTMMQGALTHLSCSDDPADPHTRQQLERFADALARMRQAGLDPPLIHAANSGGVLGDPESWLNTVRPGLALYGLHPSGAPAPGLRPILSFKSRVMLVKRVPAGSPLGYGHAFVTRRESVIGTLPAGYADGVTRKVGSVGAALVRGMRAPYAGRISMDSCMVDLTDVPGAEEGDEAVLIGSQTGPGGAQGITADQFAAWGGTVAYEVLTRLGIRVPRVHQENL